MEVEGLKPRREPAVSTGCGQPTPQDVREIAKAAAAAVRQRALSVWGGSWITLYSDEQIADAVLAAVEPVIRQQERERIAQAIDEEVEFETRRVFPSALAIDAFRQAAAIARSHSTQAPLPSNEGDNQ